MSLFRSDTLVIQACSAAWRLGWQGRCMDTVAAWAAHRGHDYRFAGEDLFAQVPAWYLAKAGDKLPVVADYGRLLLLQQALAEGYAQVVWVDADVVVFDPRLQLQFDGSCAFGHEVWVQAGRNGLEARRNVTNAVCVFRQGCVVLPFLLHTVASLMRRVDPARIAPQFVGPKLLNALQPLCDFALLPQVGALSPAVVADLCGGEGAALALLREKSAVPLQAANLCASLLDGDQAGCVLTALLAQGRL